MDDAAKFYACLQYLRRTNYTAGVWNVAAIQAIATAAYAEATTQVTLISTSSDLGTVTGQVTFDKAILLAAVENLLAEVDPNAPPPAPTTWVPDHSGRYVQT